jgi:RNA polymerase sigma-70 factor (ECF subfamily)
MAEKDLEQVIIGCRNGDERSFSELVDLYGRRCYGYFYRLTGNRVVSEDLLSELFVKLVEKIKSYRGGAFESWLFTIASNVFHDHLRAKQRQQKLLKGKREQLESKAADTGRDDVRFDRVQMQLEKLDSDVREVIMLRYYSELSFKEIAAMRGEPIGTTLSKVHRGLKKLRELME